MGLESGLGGDRSRSAEEPNFADAQEAEYAGAEMAYLAVPEHVHELMTPPPVSKKTPLNRFAQSLNQDRAQEFLGSSLPWGETGQDFIMRLKAADGDLPFYEIVRGCEKVAEMQKERRPMPREVRDALGRACQCNLLVSGESADYPRPGVGAEVKHAVYAVAVNPEVEALLGSRAVGGGGATAEQLQVMKAFLAETPFLWSPDPMRAELTNQEFFRFLTEPRTLNDIVERPDFFVGNQPQCTPALRTALEGKLNHARNIGLITISDQAGRRSQFVISVAGRGLLSADE